MAEGDDDYPEPLHEKHRSVRGAKKKAAKKPAAKKKAAKKRK
jgi:hypothetical protein